MNNILFPEEVRTLGRPIGDIKPEKLIAYINEAEQTQIKPVLGDKLYHDLCCIDSVNDDRYQILLDGGEYTDKNNHFHSFSGLKVAISYFVYVKTLMSGDIESTRFGFVEKNSQYSSRISDAARSSAYNEAMEVGRVYLKECLEYCKSAGLIIENSGRSASSGGCIIRKIG